MMSRSASRLPLKTEAPRTWLGSESRCDENRIATGASPLGLVSCCDLSVEALSGANDDQISPLWVLARAGSVASNRASMAERRVRKPQRVAARTKSEDPRWE